MSIVKYRVTTLTEKDEPRYSPVEKNVNKRYVQTALYCGKCDAMIKFLQIRCAFCKGLIDWENVIDKVKE